MALTVKTRRAGVMGWPIGHSLSPRLHGYWLDKYGIDGSYVPLAVPLEDLTAALRGLAERGFAGVNVTVPHKVAALAAVEGAVEIIQSSIFGDKLHALVWEAEPGLETAWHRNGSLQRHRRRDRQPGVPPSVQDSQVRVSQIVQHPEETPGQCAATFVIDHQCPRAVQAPGT